MPSVPAFFLQLPVKADAAHVTTSFKWALPSGMSGHSLLARPCLKLCPSPAPPKVLNPPPALLQSERRVPVHGGAGGGEDGAGQAHGAGPHPGQGVHRRAHRQDQRAAAGAWHARQLAHSKLLHCCVAARSSSMSVARAPCCVAVVMLCPAALPGWRVALMRLTGMNHPLLCEVYTMQTEHWAVC